RITRPPQRPPLFPYTTLFRSCLLTAWRLRQLRRGVAQDLEVLAGAAGPLFTDLGCGPRLLLQPHMFGHYVHGPRTLESGVLADRQLAVPAERRLLAP